MRTHVPILTQSENWALSWEDIPYYERVDIQVPILTQSENWALSQIVKIDDNTFSSNPHPVRKLGAIRFLPTTLDVSTCSNPHPVRKLGAIMTNSKLLGCVFVPILTQSENWALSVTGISAGAKPPVFQSSPSPKTGRYIDLTSKFTLIIACSNPHPVRKLGAMIEILEFGKP